MLKNIINSALTLSLLVPVMAAATTFDGILAGSEVPVAAKGTFDNLCVQYPNLTVVTKPEPDEAGSLILVKPGNDPKCKWDTSKGWLVKSGMASYFIGKWHNYIFADRGTGPDSRDILVFNIKTKRLVYQDSYYEPLSIIVNKLQYWQTANILATKANCDQFAKSQQSGLNPQIQSLGQVDLRLDDLAFIKTGQTRCQLTQ